MAPIKYDNFPSYTKIELEKLQALIQPLAKKSSIYRIVAVVILSFSLVNLYHLTFGNVSNNILLGAFCLLAAIGMALYKEAIYQNKIIQKTSLAYMKARMMQTKLLPPVTRDHYMEQIDTEPTYAFQTFFEFLNKEERMKKINESKM